MAEHTPGPWKATRSNWKGEPVEHEIYIHGNEHRSRSGNCATGVAIVCGNATSYGVTDANARLIAAAPALLAACEEALRMCQSAIDYMGEQPVKDSGMYRLKTLVEAAIVQAKGQPDA